jgi:ABC-type Zn uptake system ZnuABC Zn-binding protein ZnuA
LPAPTPHLDSTGHGVKVVATTTQIGAIVREVAGDEVELTVLLKAGDDSHSYDPSPQAVVKVADANLILKNGIGLDDWLDGMLEGGEGRVVVVTEGIELRDDDDHTRRRARARP